MSWLESLVKSLAIQSFLWLAIDSAGAAPMMHRESGSYFHFLLRGWLISYYIVHQRPVISDSFREESACAKIHGPKIQGCDHRAEIHRTVACIPECAKDLIRDP